MILAIPLILLLAVFVSLGMSSIQHTWSSGFVGWVVGVVSKVAFVGKPLIDQVIRLDKWVTHALGTHFKAIEQRGVTWVASLSIYQKLIAVAGLEWPAWMLGSLDWLIHRAIPRRVKASTDPIARTATRADETAQVALRGVEDLQHVAHKGTVAKVVPIVERVAIPHAAEWEWINHHWKALTDAVLGVGAPPLTLPRPLDRALPWPFGITPKSLFRRFLRVEALLGVTGFALIMSRVLRIANPKCLSSGPIGKVARALCGLGSSALNDLLGLIVDAVIFTDICDVVKLLDKGLPYLVGPVEQITNVLDMALCHGDFSAPPDDPKMALSLPPVTGLSLSLP
jgi:hypothetical protein